MIEKLSVLVITRNRAKMLAECLNSLVSQARKPDRVIVVDNASTDKTRDFVLSFQKRLSIKYVYEKQIGIPFARNKGVQHAIGSLLLMIDDDCKASKFWIQRVVKAHKKYPKAWAIQGRTFGLPKDQLYSLLAQFHRYLSLQKYLKTNQPFQVKHFLNKGFTTEMAIAICDTRNFSVKISYLKKYKLSFDERFYRGSDSDFARQIAQQNGLIMFCPYVQVHHRERSSLAQFLMQRWHIGRTEARMADKWKSPSSARSIPWPKVLLTLFLFCHVSKKWNNLPILILLLFFDRFSYLNGWFYEKRYSVLKR